MTDFKKGGPLQNSNIFATNRLFVKNKLFKKRKKKRAPGVYNPKAKFKYEDGGEKDYIELDLSEEDVQKYIDGGYIVEEVTDPSIATLNRFIGGGALEKLKPGGANKGCPPGTYWNGTKCTKLVTLKNDKKYIDGVANWAMHSADPNAISSEYNDQIKDRLYSGKWGFDPESGALVRLDKIQPQSVTKVDDKTKASREKEKLAEKNYYADIENKKVYEESIKGAGFDPATFGKAKGTNVITGEPIYASSKEEADRINQEAINQAAIEGHAAVVNNPVFKAAAYMTPVGMAIGAMEGAARLAPDVYDFAKDPSWSGAGQIGMDVLQTAPFAGAAIKNAYKINPWAFKEAQETMLVRARPVGQNPYVNMAEQIRAKEAAGEPLKWYQKNLLNPQTNPQIAAREKYFGQWFADNPSDLDFYINPETRNFADDAQIEILKARMPKSEATKYSVKNFEDAKTLSNLHDTEYILPKDIVQSLERFSVEDLGKLQSEYKKMNTPHWLKGYKEVPTELPGSPNASISGRLKQFFNKPTTHYKSKNVGTNTSTGLTDADIAAARAEEEAWLTSPEYLKRRMKNTGESVKQVKDDVAKILKRADTATYDVNANLKGSEGAMSTNIFMNPKVAVSSQTSNPKMVLGHENIHLYSPASESKLFGKNLHKGWGRPDLADLPASQRGVYANYPTIGDAPNSVMYPNAGDYNYNMLGYEQQARHLGVMRDIAKKNNVDLNAGKKLTEKQVRDHMDEFIKTRKDVDYDYDSIWGAEIYKERERLAKELGKTLAELEVTNPAKYKEIINLSKDNAAKTITNALNKAWVVAPTVGVAGTATLLANPFQGSDGLSQQKKGGSTDDYIEIDIPEEEIQKYIAQGYIVEPVSKLKKFIS